MSRPLHIEKPSTLGVSDPFVELARETPFKEPETLSNEESGRHEQLLNQSWLRPQDRLLPPLQDPTKNVDTLFAAFCGEAYLVGTNLDNLSVKDGLDFLCTYIERIFNGEGPQDIAQYIQNNPVMRQRLETFIQQARAMAEVEDLILRAEVDGTPKSEAEKEQCLQTLAETLSRRLADQQTLWIPTMIPGEAGLEARFCYVEHSGKVTFLDTRNFFERFMEGTEISAKSVAKRDIASNKSINEMYAEPLRQIHSVNKERLHHPDFFRALLTPRMKHKWGQVDRNVGKDFFYTDLKNYLKGKISTPFKPSKRPEVEKKSHRGLFGTAKGLNSILYFTLCGTFVNGKQAKEGRDLYKRLKWEWQLSLFSKQAVNLNHLAQIAKIRIGKKGNELTKEELQTVADALNAFYPTNQPIAPNDVVDNWEDILNAFAPLGREFCRLTNDVLKNLERAALKQPGNLSISEEDRNHLYITAVEVREILTGISTFLKKHQVQSQEEPAEPKLVNFDHYFKDLKIPKRGSSGPAYGTHYHAIASLHNEEANLQLPLPPLTSFEEIEIFLETTRNRLHYFSINGGNAEIERIFLEKLLHAIPSPKTESGAIWSNLPESQIPKILNLIESLSTQIVYRQNNRKHSPTQTLLQYNLLAITETLAKRLPSNQTHLDTNTSLYAYPLLAEARSPSFVLSDGRSHQKLREIINYFYPQKGLELLFAPEHERPECGGTAEKKALFGLQSGNNIWEFSGSINLNIEEAGNATLNFFQNFLEPENPAQRQRLHDLQILDNQPTIERLLRFIREASLDPTLLPEGSSQLFTMALRSYCMHSENPPKKDEHKLLFREEPHHIDQPPTFRIITNGFQIDTRELDHSLERYEPGNNNNYLKRTKDLNDLIADVQNSYLAEGAAYQLMRWHDFNREECMDLLEPATNPYREIAGATAFIKKHLSRLSHPSVQQYLSTYIFRSLRTKSQLEDEPAVAVELIQAINNAIKHHLDLGETGWNTVLCLTRFGFSCIELIKSSGVDLPTPLPDLRETVYQHILPRTTNQKQRKEISEELLIAYRNRQPNEFTIGQPETDILIQDLLIAAISGAGDNSYRDSDISPQFNDSPRLAKICLSRFKGIIESSKAYLSSGAPTADHILSSIVQTFYPTASQTEIGNWIYVRAAEQFQSSGNPGFVLNWRNLNLCRKSGEVVDDLPREVLISPEFSKLSGAFTHAERIQGTYTWVLRPSNILVETSRWGDEVYFYKQDKDGSNLSFIRLRDLEALMPLGFYQQLHKQEQRVQCWYQAAKGGASAHIRIEIQGKEQYRIEVKERVNSINFEKSNSISPVDHKRLVAQEWSGYSEDFRNLFPKSETYTPECWREKTSGQLDTIILHGLGLSFKAKQQDGHTRVFSTEYSDYFVVPNVSVKIPENAAPKDNLKPLFLRNAAGQEKILMAYCFSNEERQANNENRRAHGLEQSDDEVVWLEYDVKDDEIIPADLKATLHYANLLAENHNYEAIRSLIPHFQSLQRYTYKSGAIKEDALLSQLIFKLLARPHHVSLSLGLTLLTIQEENHLKYPLPVGEEEKPVINPMKLLEFYILYCHYSGNAAEFRLTEAQERRILNIIQKELRTAVQAAKTWPEKKITQIAQLQVTELIAHRWNDLHAAKPPTFKERRISYISPEKYANEWKKLNQAQRPRMHHSMLSYNFVENPPPVSTLKIEKGGEFFSENFWSYYQVARSSTPVEKEALQRQIDLHSNIQNENTQKHVNILQAVLKKPEKFPTHAELTNLLHAKNAASNALRDINYFDTQAVREAARSRYEMADRTWRTALEKLCRQAEPPIPSAFKLLIRKIGFILKVFFKVLAKVWKLRHHRLTRSIKTPLKDRVARVSNPYDENYLNSWKKFDTTFDNYFSEFVDANFISDEKDPDLVPLEENLPEGDAEDPLLDRGLKEERQELQEYRDSLTRTRIYQLKNDADLTKEREKNQAQINFWNTTLKILAEHLRWQANRVPEGLDSSLVELFKRDGSGLEISWDELKELFLKNDMSAFKKKTLLSDDEITQVSSGMVVYHTLLTQVQKLERINSLLKQYEELDEQGLGNSDKGQALIQLIASSSLVKRAYEINPQNFHILCVEAAAGYFLNQKQYQKKIEMVDAHRSHNCVLFQMPTGFGKTTAVNRVATYEESYLEKHENYMRQLIINLWPERLEATNTQENREHFKEAYNRRVDRLFFDRSSQMMLDSLKHIYEELKDDLVNGRPVNVRPETAQALKLHLHMMLENEMKHPKKIPESHLQIDYLIRIRRLIRVFGVANIDEQHETKDPKRKVVYTEGDPQTLPDEQLKFTRTLFEFMLDPEIEEALGIRKNQQAKVMEITPDVYHTVVAPKLVQKFIAKYHLPNNIQDSFRQFALSEIDAPPAWLATHPHKSELSLVKGMLSYILPNSLKEAACEKYTFSKEHLRHAQEPKEFAIPCKTADKPEETVLTPSQFKNPHESLAKTHLLYIFKGLHDFQVVKLIEHLKKSSEVDEQMGIHINNTWASRFFREKLAPAGFTKPLYQLNPKDIQILTPHIKHNQDAILTYVEHIVARQIKVYPESFDSSSADVDTLFNSTVSFSATPLDPTTHNVDTDYHKMIGAHVTHLVYRDARQPDSFRVVPTGTDPMEYSLEQLASRPEVKATIDVAAWFKGNSNEAIAEAARKQLRTHDDGSILSVAFFQDSDGMLALKDVETGHVHKVGSSGTNVDTRKTIYSQDKAYGSDVKQAIDAVAQLLLDQKTTKSLAGQGGGRMRQWIQNQRLEFLFEDVVAKKIFGDNFDELLSAEKATRLLVHLLRNEYHDRAEKNYRAQPLQMDSALHSICGDKIIGVPTDPRERQKPTVRRKLLNAPGNVSKALFYYRRFRNDLLHKESIDPYEMYANLPKQQETVPWLKDYKKFVTFRTKQMKGLTTAEKRQVLKTLSKCSVRWEGPNAMALPSHIQAGNATLGMECQVLEQVQVQQQVQQHVQVQSRFTKRMKSEWDPQTNLFKPGWEKPTAIHPKMYRMANFFYNILSAPFKLGVKNKTLANLTMTLTVGSALSIALSTSLIAFGILATWAGMIGTTAFWRQRSVIDGKKCHTMRMDSVIKEHLPKRFHGIASQLGKNFLVSNNFYNEHTQNGQNKQKPFTNEQKALREIVVIQDDEKLQFIAIDGDTDRRFFTRKLKADMERRGSRPQRKIGIYNLELGMFTIQGRNKFDPTALERMSSFKKMRTFANVLNGEVCYNPSERRFLEKTAQKVGKKTFYNFMADYTLQMREKNRAVFPKTPLGRKLLGLSVIEAA